MELEVDSITLQNKGGGALLSALLFSIMLPSPARHSNGRRGAQQVTFPSKVSLRHSYRRRRILPKVFAFSPPFILKSGIKTPYMHIHHGKRTNFAYYYFAHLKDEVSISRSLDMPSLHTFLHTHKSGPTCIGRKCQTSKTTTTCPSIT